MAQVDLGALQVTDTQRGASHGWSWWLLVILFTAAAGTLGYEAWRYYRPRIAVTAMQVVTRTGSVEVVTNGVEAAGWVEPEPFPDCVPTLIASTVTKIHCIEGDAVQQGDLLIELLDEDYQIALQQAQARLDVLKADLAYAEKQSAIDASLANSGVIDALVPAKSGAEQQRIIAQLAAAQRDIELAQLNLSRTRIHAPADAIVLQRFVSEGQHVQPDSHPSELLSLYHPDKVWVRVDVNLVDINRINLDQPCEIRIESAPGKIFAGTVARILHEANIQKNTVQAKVRINAPDGGFKPEMLVRVKFLAPAQAKTTNAGEFVQMIPARALRHDANHAFVYVVMGEGHEAVARMMMVTQGNGSDGDLIEIHEGLNPSSKVIVTEMGELYDGAPVRAVMESAK